MRIAIVNDLALARAVLRRLVESVPGYVVAWTAADGAEAVRLASADRPDVILMDLVMPVMSGEEATRRIMTACPCPILIVTASVGANFGKVYEPLLDRLAKLAQAQNGQATAWCGAATEATLPARVGMPLLAIGASTGGPEA